MLQHIYKNIKCNTYPNRIIMITHHGIKNYGKQYQNNPNRTIKLAKRADSTSCSTHLQE